MVFDLGRSVFGIGLAFRAKVFTNNLKSLAPPEEEAGKVKTNTGTSYTFPLFPARRTPLPEGKELFTGGLVPLAVVFLEGAKL